MSLAPTFCSSSSRSDRFLPLGATKTHRTAEWLTRHLVRPIGTSLSPSTFVAKRSAFLYIAAEPLRFALDAKEVFAAFWLPLAAFQSPESMPVVVPFIPQF